MRMVGHGSTILCLNCLTMGAVPVDVGPETGGPREPWREKLPLCGECRDSLIKGDLGLFHARYREDRSVTRDDLRPT